MSKLGKLFSPTALAATVATGLLLGSVAIVLAEGTYSAPIHDDYWNYCNANPPEGEGTTVCSGLGNDSQYHYWCCWYPGYDCGEIDHVNPRPQWG